MVMATKKEIKEHLSIALKEVGNIIPWYDEEVKAWVFSHKKYPVEYGGDSCDEVVKNYPKYLEEFIKHRLDNRLSPIVEKETKGRGGYRAGSGRPKGTKGEPKERIYVPKDMVEWLKEVENLAYVRELKKFLTKHREIESPKQLKDILKV